MAVESVINLGIKGSDFVASTIEGINKQRENLSKKSNVEINPNIKKANTGLPLAEKIKQRREERKTEKAEGVNLKTKKERDKGTEKEGAKVLRVEKLYAASLIGSAGNEKDKDKEKDKKDKPEKSESDYAKNLKEGLKASGGQIANSVLSMDGIGAVKGVIGALTAAIPFVDGVGKAANFAIDAIVSFKEKVKQQVAIVADAMAKENTVRNSFSREMQAAGKSFNDLIGYDEKDAKGNVTRKGRSDIGKAEQAGIASAISGSMGKVTNEFAQEVGKLFVSEDGKKKYDVAQSTELAKGNFGALGTDKGFFMQQISNGFGAMPPSMKQKLTSQMYGMITPEERDEQTDYGIKSTKTGFDNKVIGSAGKGLSGGAGMGANLKNANDVQDVEDKLGNMVQGGISQTIDKARQYASAGSMEGAVGMMKNDASKVMADASAAAIQSTTNYAKNAYSDMTNSFKKSMNETTENMKNKLNSLNPFGKK
jgi:hypothetical protein